MNDPVLAYRRELTAAALAELRAEQLRLWRGIIESAIRISDRPFVEVPKSVPEPKP